MGGVHHGAGMAMVAASRRWATTPATSVTRCTWLTAARPRRQRPWRRGQARGPASGCQRGRRHGVPAGPGRPSPDGHPCRRVCRAPRYRGCAAAGHGGALRRARPARRRRFPLVAVAEGKSAQVLAVVQTDRGPAPRAGVRLKELRRRLLTHRRRPGGRCRRRPGPVAPPTRATWAVRYQAVAFAWTTGPSVTWPGYCRLARR
jgi:hypothetical protein